MKDFSTYLKIYALLVIISTVHFLFYRWFSLILIISLVLLTLPMVYMITRTLKRIFKH